MVINCHTDQAVPVGSELVGLSGRPNGRKVTCRVLRGRGSVVKGDNRFLLCAPDDPGETRFEVRSGRRSFVITLRATKPESRWGLSRRSKSK